MRTYRAAPRVAAALLPAAAAVSLAVGKGAGSCRQPLGAPAGIRQRRIGRRPGRRRRWHPRRRAWRRSRSCSRSAPEQPGARRPASPPACCRRPCSSPIPPPSRRSNDRRPARPPRGEDEAVDYQPAAPPAEAPPSKPTQQPASEAGGSRPGQRRTERRDGRRRRIRSTGAGARTGRQQRSDARRQARAAPLPGSSARERATVLLQRAVGRGGHKALHLGDRAGVIRRAGLPGGGGGLAAARRPAGRRRGRQLAPRQMFALSWSNPPGVAAAHYRLLDPGGAVLIGDTTLPWAANAIEHLSVPAAPGAYIAEVWLEDAEGARGRRSAPSCASTTHGPGARRTTPLAGVDRPLGLSLHRPPHPPERPPADLRHPRLRRLNRFLADGKPLRRRHLQPRPRPTCRAASPSTRCRSPSCPRASTTCTRSPSPGSGRPSALAGTTILRVDKTEPLTQIEGAPAGWSSEPVKLTAEASDAASGMAATGGTGGPFTAIRDRRRRADDRARRQRQRDRDRLGRAHGRLLRPRRGRQRRRWGDRQRPHQPPPATTVVRIDREPPQLAFAAAQKAQDPELIEARADGSLLRARPQPRLDRGSPCRRGRALRRIADADLGRNPARPLGLKRLPGRRVRVPRHAYDTAGNGVDLARADRWHGDAPRVDRSRCRSGS